MTFFIIITINDLILNAKYFDNFNINKAIILYYYRYLNLAINLKTFMIFFFPI